MSLPLTPDQAKALTAFAPDPKAESMHVHLHPGESVLPDWMKKMIRKGMR